jgi:predicted  nucleic acid-binding Zn-ribbon protein
MEELHGEEMRAEIASLSPENDDKDAQIESLNQQVGCEQDKAETLSSEFGDHKEAIGKLSAQLDRARHKMQNLQISCTCASFTVRSSNHSAASGATLRREPATERPNSFTQLQIEEHRPMDDEVEQLRIATSEMDKLREQNGQLKERVNGRVENERDDLLRQITEMQQDNEALHNELSSLQLQQQRVSKLEDIKSD